MKCGPLWGPRKEGKGSTLCFGGLGRMRPGKKPSRKKRDRGWGSRLASRNCFRLENRNRKRGEDLQRVMGNPIYTAVDRVKQDTENKGSHLEG